MTACGTDLSASNLITLIEPLITEVATIKTKTPKLTPSIEASEMKDNNRLCFFAKENLNPIKKDSGRRMNFLILLIQRKYASLDFDSNEKS